MDITFLDSAKIDAHELLSVYCNRESVDRFLVGSLLAHSNEGLILSLVSPDGYFDGLCYCAAAGIFRVERNSQYLRALKVPAPLCGSECFAGDLWDAFLHYAEENRCIIQLKNLSGQRTVFGIPVQRTKDTLTIQQITRKGVPGRICRIKRDRILLMVCGSDTETALQAALSGGEDL